MDTVANGTEGWVLRETDVAKGMEAANVDMPSDWAVTRGTVASAWTVCTAVGIPWWL